MTKLRDGYFRQINSKVGDDNYLLKAQGGYIGLHTGRNNEANKVVRTDENGYIQAGWINTTSGSMDGNTPARIYASYDGYIRYMTPGYFFSNLSNSGNNISITVGGQNRTLTVGYADNAEAANYLNGYTKIITVNGDINTYYPVRIPNTTRKSLINTISVWRNLGLKSAIYPGSHGSYTTGNGGGVSCWYEFVGRYNGWDGNGGYYYTRRAWYAYDRQLSHAAAPGSAVGDLFVWLRGGGTEYYVSTNYPFSDPVVYYERTNASGSSQYPSWVEPRTDIGNEGILTNTYYGNIIGNANTASGLSVTHYWANVAISTSSKTNTTPTFGRVTISGTYPQIQLNSTNSESSIYYLSSDGTGWATGPRAWGVSGFGIGVYNTSTNNGVKLTILDNGNVGIGTTSPGYKLQISGDSYTTGWSRAANGFYVEGTGVHFTHQKSGVGEIDMTSNNEFLWGSSTATLYFNYRTVSRGTTVNNYIWNAGSSTSWASHNMGNIWLNDSGVYLRLGPQNSSHAHYETNAGVSHWFNKRVDVNGDIWRYGTNYGISSDGYFYAKGVYANRDGASTYGGISLYSTSDPITEYGIAFRGTGNYGKIGRVQGDWATYFTMDSLDNRGWIFRSGGTNYASVSARGEAYFNSVGTDNYIAYPSGGFFSSEGSTGYIIITIPANYRSCTMMRFNVEIYNYSSGTSTTYTIGGYNYDDGNWYNVFAYANRQGTTGYGNLTVRFGHNGTNSIIWIGESNTSYSYPKIRITNVTLGHGTVDYNTWAAGWSVTIATTAPTNVSQTVTNPATNYYAESAGSAGYADNANKLDNIDSTGFLAWTGMSRSGGSSAPFQTSVDFFNNTANLNAGARMIYSYLGGEYTILYTRRSDDVGHGTILRWGYPDNYIRMIRMISGSPQTSDWEKISAGYADSAGDADKLDGYHANDFATAGHTHDGRYLRYEGWWSSGSGQNVDNANGMTFVYGDHGSPNGWGILCTFDYTYNSDYKFQLFAEGYSASGMYYRCRSSDRGGWTSWKTVIDDGNIGSQSVNYANYSEYSTRLDGGAIAGWGTLTSSNGFSGIAAYDWGDKGAFCWAGKSDKMYMQVDGWFYQNEGQYRVLDTSDAGSLSVNYANYAGYLTAYTSSTGGTGANKLYLWHDWNNTGSLGTYFHGIWVGSPDGNIGYDLAYLHGDKTHLYMRSYDYGTWNSWYKICTNADTYVASDGTNRGIIDGSEVASVRHLLINGVTWNSDWNWSGQSGQPSWLWGSNDGVNMYVWDPSNFSVNYADSAGSAIYITPQSYTPTSDTVGGHKDGLVKWLNTDSTTGIGKNIIISESIISQWDNDSAKPYPSSVYAMIKIGGGYNHSTYGQWLLSSYNQTRLGVVGRTGSVWSSIKWIAWTSDIPTKISQLTNDSGYITSSGSCNYANSAGSASSVTVNSSDSNSTYRMVWHSGNTLYGTGGIYCNPYTDYLYATSMNTSDWFRSTGSTGWYNESYGGGWYMTDSSWVRTYNGKGVVSSGFYHSNYGSSAYALTSDGDAAKIADMSVNYADSAGSASSVTVNSSDSNSTYRMVWHSGNTLYGTGGIYCNPYTDYLYATSMNTSDWFRSTGSTGWYNESYGGGIYMSDSTYVRVYNDKSFYNSNSSQYAFYTPGGITVGSHLWGTSAASTWIDGQRYDRAVINVTNSTDANSFWPLIRWTSSSQGRWDTIGVLGNNLYFMSSATSKTDNGYDTAAYFDMTTSRLYSNGLYHTSYGSSDYALTSDGGAALISSMSVNYANSAGDADTSNRTKFLETFQQNSTTNTYGSQYPIWAQWSDSTNVRLKCTNYTVWTDKANYANSADNANYLNQQSISSEDTAIPDGTGFAVYKGNTSATGGDGHIMSFGWSTGSYGAQIYIDTDPTYNISIRQRNGSAWQPWKKILTEANYTEIVKKINYIDTNYLFFCAGSIYKNSDESARPYYSTGPGFSVTVTRKRSGAYQVTVINNNLRYCYIYPIIYPLFKDKGSGSCYEHGFAYLSNADNYEVPIYIVSGGSVTFTIICGYVHTQNSWKESDFTKSNDGGGFICQIFASWQA